MVFLGVRSDKNVRLNLKIKSIVKSTILVIWKHLVAVSILNLIIAFCYNYIIKAGFEEQLNVVAYLLRGTFISSIPSCVTLFLLICCTEYNWNNRPHEEWNFMNVFCAVLIFYSITFTKTIFSKEFVDLYEVMHLIHISYLLQIRFNYRKRKAHDYQFHVSAEAENFHRLLEKGTILNITPSLLSYGVSFLMSLVLAIIDSLSVNIILSIITHPFEMFLNIPTIYNLINIYQVENYSYLFCLLSSIWITALFEYHFTLTNFVFSKYDSSIITTLKSFPMHNTATYDDEYLVVNCIYEYLKNVSYRISRNNIEITNVDKATKLKLLLFKKIILINVNLQKNGNTNSVATSPLKNPINTLLLEDVQIWSQYVESCILCMEDLISHFKKYLNVLNHDETIYSYEEKEEVRNVFEKPKIRKLKDIIRLACMYFKGLSVWTAVISIICKDLISSYVRKLAASIVGLSFVLFDFLNFVKINELYDMLHMLLYEMNGLIDVFKFYKDDILDNKYQYSYNLYKGLAYIFRNQTIKC